MRSPKTLIKVLRKLSFTRKLKLSYKLKLREHFFIIPVITELGYVNVFLKENWISQLIEKCNLKSDETFVDIGVNVGQSLLQLKSVNADVQYVGFEPNVYCCYYVSELICANNFKNCELLNFALSNELCLVDLEFDSETDSRASINATQRPNYFKNKMKVLALPYDQILTEKKVSCIKIDVEGAELNVLKGLKNQLLYSKSLVICEVLDSHNEFVLDQTQKQADELFSFLEAIDYSVIQLIQHHELKLISDFKVISQFNIQLWEKKSSLFNDYLFVHRDNLEKTIQILSKIKM